MLVSRQRGLILFLEVVHRSNLSLHIACDAKTAHQSQNTLITM
jgi:hypothetical protein